MADGFDKPNGLALLARRGASSTSATRATSDPPAIEAFDVVDGARARPTRRRASPSSIRATPTASRSTPPGASTRPAPAGVQVFDPDGRRLGAIDLPGAVNFAFGGAGPPLHHRRHRRVGRRHPRSPKEPERHATRPHPSRHRHRRRRRRDRRRRAGRRRARGARVVHRVVDPSGEVVALRRTHGAQVASARVAVDKARTAAIFVRPEPRDGGAGHERPPRRARAARRRRA